MRMRAKLVVENGWDATRFFTKYVYNLVYSEEGYIFVT